MRYLRAKVDRPFGVESIETVRGVGYRLRSEPNAQPDAVAETAEPARN
jgi:two-component system OmpR family response regulator